MRVWINLGALFLVLSLPAQAIRENWLCEDSPFDQYPDAYYTCEAMQSFKHGFDTHALEHLKRASKWGSKTAQYRVGLMILGGIGTEADPIEGAAWLLLANERNNSDISARLREVQDKMSTEDWEVAHQRALVLKEEYGDFAALERRTRWVRRMKNRMTGSRLGKPMATVRVADSQGITVDQMTNRLDVYERSLRHMVTTVEYRDFRVIEPKTEGR